MKNEKFFQLIVDWSSGQKDSKNLIIESNFYDQITETFYETELFELDQEHSTLNEILEASTNIYFHIHAVNDCLGITHPSYHDDVLIFLICERMKKHFNKNFELEKLSVMEFAKLFSAHITQTPTEFPSVTAGQMFTIIDGEFLMRPETSTQALNDLIFRKKKSNADLANLCGFSIDHLTAIRSGDIPLGKQNLFIIAFALSLTKKEFLEFIDRIPQSMTFDFTDDFGTVLIDELDQAPAKKRIEKLSGYNAVEYIRWLYHEYLTEKKIL